MGWKDKFITDFTKKYVFYENKNGILFNADCLHILKQFPDNSVDCMITSPPYWGKRYYKGKSYTIFGGDPSCKHKWKPLSIGKWNTEEKICEKCGAWRGILGLEHSFDLYIEHLKEIFKEVYRILKPSGTCWVNIGDTYISKGGPSRHLGYSDKKYKSGRSGEFIEPASLPQSIKPKSLALIPFRFALAMQEIGWIIRNDNIWVKKILLYKEQDTIGNGMPEPTKDRFNKTHEYVFLMTKEENYYFNLIKIPYKKPLDRWGGEILKQKGKSLWDKETGQNLYRDRNMRPDPQGKMPPGVWLINTKATEKTNTAVFPPELPELCLKYGCPNFVCSNCGTPREKIYERVEKKGKTKQSSIKAKDDHSPGKRKHYLTKERRFILPKSMKISFALWLKERIKGKEPLLDKIFGKDKWSHWIRTDDSGQSLPSPSDYKKLKEVLSLDNSWDKWLLEEIETIIDDTGNSFKFVDWSPICRCGNKKWERGVVLDIFSGVGTSLLKARELGYNWIGIEINEDYCEITKRRIDEEKKRVKLFS